MHGLVGRAGRSRGRARAGGPARRPRARPARPLPPPGRPRALPRGPRARPPRSRPARGDAGRSLAFDRTCRCGAPHGKPVLPGGPGFSLSHAGDLVGVAVRPDGPVGLDVEQLRDVADLDALAAHVRSPAERSASRPGPRRVLPHLDAQGGARQGHRRRAVGPHHRDHARPDRPAVERWTGPGAPSGPMWLHDLSPHLTTRPPSPARASGHPRSWRPTATRCSGPDPDPAATV